MMRKSIVSFIVFLSAFSLSAQVKWKVKEDAYDVRFKIKNLGVWVEGSFKGLSADINFDPARPETAVINASIDASTINTGIGGRDNHLRKEEYFDVEHHPKISIQSTSIEKKGDQLVMNSKLTIKSTTTVLSIPFVFGEVDGKAVFRAEFEIKRTDYGVGGSGGPMGETVYLTLSVPVTRQ